MWRLIKLTVFCVAESFGEDKEVIDWKVFPTAWSGHKGVCGLGGAL